MRDYVITTDNNADLPDQYLERAPGRLHLSELFHEWTELYS